jgi:hypothetical protein
MLAIAQICIIFTPVIVTNDALAPLTTDPYTIYWGQHHARLQTQAEATRRGLPFAFNPPLLQLTVESWQLTTKTSCLSPICFVTWQVKTPKVMVYLIDSNKDGFVPLEWHQFADPAEAETFAKWLGRERRVVVKGKHVIQLTVDSWKLTTKSQS